MASSALRRNKMSNECIGVPVYLEVSLRDPAVPNGMTQPNEGVEFYANGHME